VQVSGSLSGNEVIFHPLILSFTKIGWIGSGKNLRCFGRPDVNFIMEE